MREPIGIICFVISWLFLQANANGASLGSCSFSCSSVEQQGASQLNNPERGPVGAPGKAGPPGPPGPQGERGDRGVNSAGTVGSASEPGLSCDDLYDKGIREDGVYFIKIDRYSSVFQTYCDMTSTTNGWTLVASIHENDIAAKCLPGDKWSSENWAQNYTEGGSSWSNSNIFGDVVAATSADYKNPAYSTLQSSNVMVWHVPNDTPLRELRDEAKHIYKTSNRFLDQTGGTLRTLFLDHYPLIKLPEKRGEFDSILDIMKANSLSVMQAIPNFHEYVYAHSGDAETNIQDGGSDIFDTGNQIQYSVNNGDLSPLLVYGETIFDVNGPVIVTDKGHPFLFLAWIGDNGLVNQFKVKVTSNLGADGSGTVNTISNSNMRLQNGFMLRFVANEVDGASDPSCAQVFFIIENENLWGTAGRISTSTPEWETENTQHLNDEFLVSGSPRNILVGYTLLTKTTDAKITGMEIENALGALINNLEDAEIDSIRQNSECSDEINSLAVPVSILKGSAIELSRSAPSQDRGEFEPNFVHFRAWDTFGLPSAFCPGVKSTGCVPSKMCVGGINTAKYGRRSQCGDFGQWDGNLTLDSLLENTPSQTAKAIVDIQSTILIFYGP